jgi:hypothetical protein
MGASPLWNNEIKAIQPTNKNRGISIVINKERFRFITQYSSIPIFQHSILRVKSK